MTEVKGSEAGAATGVTLGLLRQPSIVGSAGALMGLLVGVIVGRASVAPPQPSDTAPTPFERSEGRLAARPPVPVMQEPPQTELRRAFGQRAPTRDEGVGFDKVEVAGRRAVRLSGAEVLQFEIAAKPEDYVFAAVVHLEGATAATLEPRLDGHALSNVSLASGWGMYSSPVPRDRLTGKSHELRFGVTSKESNAQVSLDSLAILPVGKTAKLSMGKGAVGNLIEGFARPGEGSTWSVGQSSLLGVVLSPAAVSYELKVTGSPASGAAPQRVQAKVNGKDLGVVEIERKGEMLWTVPAKALRSGVNQIELGYSKTARPSQHDPNSKDNRELALRLFELSLAPAK